MVTTQSEERETIAQLELVADRMSQSSAVDCLAPPKIAEKAETAGITKSKLNTLSTLLLGGMAGVFIGLGAMLCTLATTGIDIGFGLTKLLGGFVFCLGLILVVVSGAELFTGNNLLMMGFLSGRISLGRLTRNWILVYVANLVGALALVALMFYSNQWTFNGFGIGANALSIANAKVNLSFGEALARGILCNFLVCLAVWMCFGARTVGGKVMAILFPITAFVAAGFEHSVANMYFIPMGILMANQPAVLEATGLAGSAVANLNWLGFVGNLVPVTIGNLIGGGLLVGGIYWISYLRQDRAAEVVAKWPWMGAIFPAARQAKAAEPVADSLNDVVRGQLEELIRTKQKETEKLDNDAKALLEVLGKAKDDGFMARLTDNSAEVLQDYDLTTEAKAALASGDIRWIESKVGVLAEPLRGWLLARLSQEKW